ncbi:MAG TPA: alpha/beta hydrolase [Jiangellaceae bacterium]|nr:alpha/beta hydrolase [Jiangellaceae bacterium]
MPTSRGDRDVLTRHARPADLHIQYAEHEDGLVDVWLPPDDSAPAPLVLVLHGGFWRAAFDRTHLGPMCEALAARGFAAAAPEYRRVGGAGGWPTTFDDIARAVEQVPSEIAGLAGNRVRRAPAVLVGHSAGGHLALWAVSHRRSPATAAGVVALAPVADIVAARRAGLGNGAVDELLAELPSDQHKLVDPVRLLPAGTPTVLVHGTADDRVPVSQSRDYRSAAVHAGDDCRLAELDGVGHFALIDPGATAFDVVVEAITRLVPPSGNQPNS